MAYERDAEIRRWAREAIRSARVDDPRGVIRRLDPRTPIRPGQVKSMREWVGEPLRALPPSRVSRADWALVGLAGAATVAFVVWLWRSGAAEAQPTGLDLLGAEA